MQLQTERDHFINGGIRTGGGGSSSSSPTSSAVSSPSQPSSPSLSPTTKVELSSQHLLRLKNAFSSSSSSTHRQHVSSPPTPPPQPAFVASALSSSFSLSCQTGASSSNATASASASTATHHRRRPSPVHSRATSPVIPDLAPLSSSAAVCQPAAATVPPTHAGQLALLPSELLFHILCLLPAVDLCRLALTSKFYYTMSRDRAVWRIKCRQHMLFSTRHLYAQPLVDWFAYYRYLHRNRRMLNRNWGNATPQSVTLLEGHSSLVTSLELSLWTLVTCSIDSTVRVWNLRTFECIQVLRCKHSLTCVTQCDSIGAVCARTSFGALIIWDVKTGQVVLQDDYALPQIASFLYMDERYIGYGATNGDVTIYDWSSRSQLEIAGSYQEHTGDVIHVSILNKQIVISASTSGETLLYSLLKRRIIGRFLLPGAAQSIQFTPTICGNKVMFSTQEAIFEYELDIQDLVSSFNQEMEREEEAQAAAMEMDVEMEEDKLESNSNKFRIARAQGSSSSSPPSCSPPLLTRRAVPQVHASQVLGAANRNWKTSNSLLSQIRQKIGPGKSMELALDDRPLQQPSGWTQSSSVPCSPSLSTSFTLSFTRHTASSSSSPSLTPGATSQSPPAPPRIPTRFPNTKSVFCIPPGSRLLDHGTTSARCSFGVFMRQNCATLNDIAVYSRETKRLRTWRGAAVDRMLRDAVRNQYYTTMECNEHCAVLTSGERVYVVSFLPQGV